MQGPKVSIVIPAYNASNYLSEAIDSALAQTYPNVEVVVVNDGSPDDGATRAVALSYGDRIRYVEKENGGSSSALNVGIQNMSGEWFSWLSHDDLYAPDKLLVQMQYLESLALSADEIQNHVFFAGSNLIDADGKVIREPNEKQLLAIERELSLMKTNAELVAEPTKYLFHGCSCLIHKSVFERIGAFDEQLRLLNDVDMWYRIYTNGFTVHFIPKRLVSGRVHAKQVSRSIGYSYHNPEQDMFWERALEWLKASVPENEALLFRFGRNAYLKTRNREGDQAFALISLAQPEKKFQLTVLKLFYKIRAGIRTLGKKIYLKIKA